MSGIVELAVVVPAFNEEVSIQSLIEDWQDLLNRLNINHEFIVINDGSRDRTAALLSKIAGDIPNLKVYTQSNIGHGPTIYKGYQLAMHAEWVFQTDGDYQFETELFNELWKKREHYDLLLGERKVQSASVGRKLISQACRSIVHLLYGWQIRDINSPYRLIRSVALREALNKIRENEYAPNVLISSVFMAKRYRILVASLGQRKNAIVKKSKLNVQMLSGSLNSFISVLALRFKL
jgi:dolichol-phosphate mannosyltransferase